MPGRTHTIKWRLCRQALLLLPAGLPDEGLGKGLILQDAVVSRTRGFNRPGRMVDSGGFKRPNRTISR